VCWKRKFFLLGQVGFHNLLRFPFFLWYGYVDVHG
jgi:hypothetical protein